MTKHSGSCACDWRGVTLIECLIVVTILGVLIAIIVPAVQSAREAARRVQCTNQMKQIAVALQNHHGVYGRFPAGTASRFGGSIGDTFSDGTLSIHYQLLPYLEYNHLYNAINTLVEFPSTNTANSTSVKTKLTIFICPSDDLNLTFNSYRGCTGPFPFLNDGTPWLGGGGVFPGLSRVSSKDIRDGLSLTCGFSERVSGSGSNNRFNRSRDIWYSYYTSITFPKTSDELMNVCSSLTSEPSAYTTLVGGSWIHGGLEDTLFNSVSHPNLASSDCSAESPPVSLQAGIGGGSVSARSMHTNGINVMMMDGVVKFTKNSINLNIWRAIASKSGGELYNDIE